MSVEEPEVSISAPGSDIRPAGFNAVAFREAVSTSNFCEWVVGWVSE